MPGLWRPTVDSRLAMVLAAGWLMAGACGCAAVKASQQPGKKNLAVLSPGVPRTHVIAELGAPTWSEDRGGVTTDVFAFKQGYSKGVKASRAFAHCAADVVTGGLWEVVGIPAETLADGTDVKVSIEYDEDRVVQSVTVIEGEKVLNPRGLFSRKRKDDGPKLASQPAAGDKALR